MQFFKYFILFSLSLTLINCGDTNSSKQTGLKLDLNGKSFQLGDTLKLSVKNPKALEIQQIVYKLDGNEIVKPLYIPKDIRLQIQQARCAQNLSQKDLANRLSVKKSIINDLESGKLLMNKTFIKKVKNILNIK